MYDFQKKAAVLVGDLQVELGGFHKEECYTHILINNQWVYLDGRSWYLFGIRFTDGKLRLLFDERPRRYSDPQAWHSCECRPADEESSRVLRELFEDKAYEGPGCFVHRVPLVWPWVGILGAG